MLRTWFVPIAMLVLLPACSVSFFGTANLIELGRVNQRVPLASEQHSVHVRNNVGSVTIYCDQAAHELAIDAVVRIKKGRRDQFATADVARDLTVLASAGVLTVRNAHLEADDHNDWGLDLEIHMPNGLDLIIENSVGDVSVQGEPAGLSVDLDVGQLHATLGAVPGDVVADVKTGDATLACEQVNGRMMVTLGVGDATLQVRQGFPKDGVNLELGTGDARLLMPANAAANVELEVATGDLEIGAPFALETHGHLVGQSASGMLSDHGPLLRASVGVGSIELKAAR